MDALAQLRSQLTELGSLVHLVHPDRRLFEDRLWQLQQGFQALAAGDQTAIQPALTEISRVLRLIAVDMAFLRASRQPQTIQHRQAQIGDRLAQLATWLDYLQRQSPWS